MRRSVVNKSPLVSMKPRAVSKTNRAAVVVVVVVVVIVEAQEFVVCGS